MKDELPTPETLSIDGKDYINLPREAFIEIYTLRNLCAVVYQACGALNILDAPKGEAVMDCLSDAANGHTLRHNLDDLLPFDLAAATADGRSASRPAGDDGNMLRTFATNALQNGGYHAGDDVMQAILRVLDARAALAQSERGRVLEEAAKVCDGFAIGERGKQYGQYDNQSAADQSARECAAAIRALAAKGTK